MLQRQEKCDPVFDYVRNLAISNGGVPDRIMLLTTHGQHIWWLPDTGEVRTCAEMLPIYPYNRRPS